MQSRVKFSQYQVPICNWDENDWTQRLVHGIIDGHKSHIQHNVLKLAFDNGIEIAKLPAHTTHLLQALDLGVFKPLKEAYDREAHAFFLSNRRYINNNKGMEIVQTNYQPKMPSEKLALFHSPGNQHPPTHRPPPIIPLHHHQV